MGVRARLASLLLLAYSVLDVACVLAVANDLHIAGLFNVVDSVRIQDIFRIRIRGSMPLTNGSGSCYFHH
jgi:hypothetical protein